mgnify:CR=1 FL=1
MHVIPAACYLARRKRQNLLLGLLALVALCMLLLGVSVGNGVVRLPLGLSEHELALFVRLRLPRVLMGALVGAGLAMSGTLAQAVLRNPLASPFTLGISSGAAFGAALAILLGGASQWGMAGNAFVFAALTAFAALGFARLRDSRPETLILGGVAIMFLFSAATSLLQYVATEYQVQAIVFWGFGNLGRVGWSELGMAAVMILLPVPFALKLSWDLNVRRLRIGGILAASLMAAGAICFTGVIGFIGLVAPHIARLALGAEHRFLIPGAALFGASLVTFSDVLARNICPPQIIPIGILTSFLGVPFFFWLLMRKGQNHA